MIKMIGWIEGVICGKGYAEYLAFYMKDDKLIVAPFVYSGTLRRVQTNELLKSIKVFDNQCTVDLSNYESFHYFISTQRFKTEDDICNIKWYGQPVSEDAFNKYLAEQTNEQQNDSYDKNILNTFKNNDVFKELLSNIGSTVTTNVNNQNETSKSIFEELMKHLNNIVEDDSSLSNNEKYETFESGNGEIKDHSTVRLFGWISFDNIRTAVFMNELEMDTISFDVTTQKIVEDPFKFDFINNTVCFKENNLLTFNRLIINSNNIEKDIIDFEDRDINCVVSKEEFLEIIGIKEIDFSYEDLIELLQKKQINPMDIAKNYHLL